MTKRRLLVGAAVLIALAVVQGPGAACRGQGSKTASPPPPAVIIRLISVKEGIPGRNPALGFRLSAKGEFRGAERNLAGDPPLDKDFFPRMFREDLAERGRSGEPVRLWVELTEEKQTPPPVLLSRLNAITTSVPPGLRVEVYVRLEGLAGPPKAPRKK